MEKKPRFGRKMWTSEAGATPFETIVQQKHAVLEDNKKVYLSS